MTSIKDSLIAKGLDISKIDGWVEENVFVGKESVSFVLTNDDGTKKVI